MHVALCNFKYVILFKSLTWDELCNAWNLKEKRNPSKIQPLDLDFLEKFLELKKLYIFRKHRNTVISSSQWHVPVVFFELIGEN